MRHLRVAALQVTLLPSRVVVPPPLRSLVLLAGASDAVSTGLAGAVLRAVTMAAVATAVHRRRSAASLAVEVQGCVVDLRCRRPGVDGRRNNGQLQRWRLLGSIVSGGLSEARSWYLWASTLLSVCSRLSPRRVTLRVHLDTAMRAAPSARGSRQGWRTGHARTAEGFTARLAQGVSFAPAVKSIAGTCTFRWSLWSMYASLRRSLPR